jgi:multiple antibiotic resistance protein
MNSAMEANLFYVFVTLLVMINPVEAAATFDTVTAGDDAATKKRIALRSTIIAGVILLGFGFIGDALLRALGISFAAFRIAGGLLLLRVGFNMVFDAKKSGDTSRSGAPNDDPTVFPLAIPIITGPGALTAIVTLMTRTHDSPLKVSALVIIAIVVMAITYVTMRASTLLNRLLGASGVDAVGRITGIIVAAISIQLVIDGIAEMLPTLLKHPL